MDLVANQKVVFDMHLINAGVDTLHTNITLNARKADTRCGFQVAGAHVSFNVAIAIPPNGAQTVSGNCTPPPGAKYFYMTTKTRKRGVFATISRLRGNGAPPEELVRSTQWDAPTVRLWSTPPFLAFGAGETFRYSCSYLNDRASVVTVGTSAENNEWCSAITYYFPAAPNTPSCN